ncbi:MAG: zinc ribbon domain-containing protein [Saprospiraceae bacterium]|nr:zinc ribbon domain-containing protein [Saprospiraceae bacterium]
MNCLRCNTPNEEGAKFCKNCGMDMTYTPSNESTNSKSSDTFLIIFISVAFISAIAQFAIQKLVDNWYESPTKYIQASLWLLQNLSFILIPLAIRNKTLKIVGFIITAIMVIYWVYTNVEFMTS